MSDCVYPVKDTKHVGWRQGAGLKPGKTQVSHLPHRHCHYNFFDATKVAATTTFLPLS